MVINDFSTLLQLAATLNIAFVAVEYAKAYTHTLSEKVFKFQDFILESFKKCHVLLLDRETLEHMEPVDVGGKSTNNKIEKAKRDYEILSKKIEQEEERLNGSVKRMCESKSLSSLSLWLFLYSTTSLFLCGIENYYPCLVKVIWILMSFFTLLYISVGWCIGEKDNKRFVDFASLRHSILFYAVSLVVSFLCSIVLDYYCENLFLPYWNYILIISSLIPYTNFVMFFIKTKGKAKSIRQEIESSANISEIKCNTLKEAVSDLLSVNKISKQLAIDD